MKRLYMLLVIVSVCYFSAIANENAMSSDRFVGKWNVRVADVQQEFQNYVFDIREEGTGYRVDILFVSANRTFPNREFTLKDGKLTGSLAIEGEGVSITIWEEQGVMQGTASSSWIGTVKMAFSRPE